METGLVKHELEHVLQSSSKSLLQTVSAQEKNFSKTQMVTFIIKKWFSERMYSYDSRKSTFGTENLMRQIDLKSQGKQAHRNIRIKSSVELCKILDCRNEHFHILSTLNTYAIIS